MRRAVGILSIAIAPLFAAGLALADDRYGTPEHGSSPGAASGQGTGAMSGTSGSTGFMGQHMLTGTVTDIDRDEGKLKLDAEGKDLTLHFPKTALQNINKGDRVTVQLAIKPAGSSSGTSGTRGSGAGSSGAGTHEGGSRSGTMGGGAGTR